MPALQILSLAALPVLGAAVLSDLAFRTVPNWASAVILACGVAARLVTGDLGTSLGYTAVLFGCLYACWRLGALGGGDVKLLTACAILVPAGLVPALVLAVAVAGGVLGFSYLGLGLVARQAHRSIASFDGLCRPMSGFSRIAQAELSRVRQRGPLPYACAIAAGCVFTLISA